MDQKYDKFLPIGSIVLLNNATKKVMICGFCAQTKDGESNVFDYIGCLYPEGILDTDKNLLFNHTDIKTIYAIGYSDDEGKAFNTRLKNEIEKVDR